MKRVSSAVATLAVVLAYFAVAPSAHATSIGVNFTSNRGVFASGPNPVAPGDVLGLVPQANWNNTQPQTSGVTADIASPVAGIIVDSTGAATAATFNWSGTGNIQEVTNSGAGGSNAALYHDYLESGFTDHDSITINVGNVPYASYNVIL